MEQPDESILREFVAESRDHLNAIEPDLLTMEEQGSEAPPEVINRVFRAIHSIKGGAGFFAFERLKQLSHAMEGVLMQVRDGRLGVTREIMDALLKALDRLRAMLDDLGESEGIPIVYELTLLRDLLEGSPGAHAVAPPAAPAPPASWDLETPEARAALARGMRLYQVDVPPRPDLAAQGRAPEDLLQAAATVGSVLAAAQPGGPFLFATVLEPELAALALQLPEARLTPVTAPEAPKPAPEVSAPPPATEAARPAPREAAAETLRVRLDLLTGLMNLAGELVLGRNQLFRALNGPQGRGIPGLTGILQNLNQVTTALQEGIMQTRMQPIGTLFNRFPRIARDMSRLLSKQIEVEMKGAEVELDKSIVELLTDPLTHLIRNCADHAIEAPAERAAAGKDPVGRIHLHAYHQGGQVCIEIRDDGRGIDPANVRRKAVERKVVDAAQAEAMTDRDIVNLIFAPGFSTAEAVTEFSGRGVGMDVVRTNTEKLGGHVALETQVGEGTTVFLRLPLTLAIIPSMLVGVGAMRLAIPQVNVVEFVWVKAAEVAGRVERVHGAQVLRLRQALLPLVRLADVLGCQRTFLAREAREPASDRRREVADRRAGRVRPTQDRRQDWRSDYNIVVVRVGPNRFGIIVDELFDIEEIVVKPLSAFLKGCRCFSGATILGDGRVIMILDMNGVAAQAQLHFPDLQADEGLRREEERRLAAQSASRRRSVILFTAGPGEHFAVPQDRVLRLERLSMASIERLGEKEFVNHQGEALPLLRLDRLMAVRPLPDDLADAFILIPNVGRAVQGGILIASILDALDVEVELKPVALQGPGILGSARVQDQLTLFLDPVALAKAAQDSSPKGALSA